MQRQFQQIRKAVLGLCGPWLYLSGVAYGQSGTDSVTEVRDAQTVLDESPLVSARASAMGGALSTLADDPEAIYFNPAGIGGLGPSKKKQPALRNLNFPRLGVAANENAKSLQSEFSDQNGANNRSAAETIIDASEGDRQYGRLSYLLGLTLHRVALAAYSDVQLAALKENSSTEGTNGDIALKYQTLNAAGAGFSMADPKDRFYFGAFASYNSLSITEASGLSYSQIINVDERRKILSDNSEDYTGLAINVGTIMVFSKQWRPSLGIVARNVGGTVYSGSGTDHTVAEDLTAGFSVSPRLGKIGFWSLVVEGHHLTDINTALGKKLRAGTEFAFGDFGGKSYFALRGGYSSAGASYGLGLNIGLIKIEAASEEVDIGVENKSIRERRLSGVLSVNLATD